MDGSALLGCCVEAFVLGGAEVRGLSRGAEAVVAAAHAVYKEHMVLLLDCLTVWSWLSDGAVALAERLGASGALQTALSICGRALRGEAELPYKLSPPLAAWRLLGRLARGGVIATLPNFFNLLTVRGGRAVVERIRRRSY